jgi:hypothetical protein
MRTTDIQKRTINLSISQKPPENKFHPRLLVAKERNRAAVTFFEYFYRRILFFQTGKKKIENFAHIPEILCCQHIVFAKKYRLI